MHDATNLHRQRIIYLIRAIRDIGTLFPGDKIKMIGEKPATYLGAIESGDLQVDYLQLHAFTLEDGIQVVVEAPSLNRKLGRFLY